MEKKIAEALENVYYLRGMQYSDENGELVDLNNLETYVSSKYLNSNLAIFTLIEMLKTGDAKIEFTDNKNLKYFKKVLD